MNYYTGQILAVGFNYAPQYFATCNGVTLNIQQYTALFALLGTQFGGNGQTTFQLPDLGATYPVGQGTGPGLAPVTVGEQFGSNFYTLTSFPAHSHTLNLQLGASASTANVTSPAGAVLAAIPPGTGRTPTTQHMLNTSGSGSNMAAIPAVAQPLGTSGQPGPVPINLHSPCQGINYVICLNGVFPPRD